MKFNYWGTAPHTKHNTPAKTVKAFYVSECNKSLSIYLFLSISSPSTKHNEKANQIFTRLVIKRRPFIWYGSTLASEFFSELYQQKILLASKPENSTIVEMMQKPYLCSTFACAIKFTHPTLIYFTFSLQGNIIFLLTSRKRNKRHSLLYQKGTLWSLWVFPNLRGRQHHYNILLMFHKGSERRETINLHRANLVCLLLNIKHVSVLTTCFYSLWPS